MAGKRYIAHRTERVSRYDKTYDLVAGEPVPAGLSEDDIDQLLDSQQIYDANAAPGFDIYSQEYRNLQTAEDAEEDKGKK